MTSLFVGEGVTGMQERWTIKTLLKCEKSTFTIRYLNEANDNLQGLDQQGRRQQDNNLQNSQNSAYEGADSLRNQANKMFAR